MQWLYLLCNYASVSAEHQTHWRGGHQSFLTGSGLFALHLPGYLSNVVGAWSLGIEIAFYAAFPIVCLLANNARLRMLLIVLATLVVAQQAVLLLLQRMASEDPTRF